jgi:branched-chain amino acid transport system permease protein
MIDFVIAMFIGGLAAGFFALLIEQLLITRLYDRHIDQALVTVGVSLVVGAVLGGWFTNDLKMFPTPLWFYTAINIGGAMIPADRIVYIATAVILLVANWALLKFTRIGLIIRAGVENRNMVNALGINVRLAFSLFQRSFSINRWNVSDLWLHRRCYWWHGIGSRQFLGSHVNRHYSPIRQLLRHRSW